MRATYPIKTIFKKYFGSANYAHIVFWSPKQRVGQSHIIVVQQHQEKVLGKTYLPCTLLHHWHLEPIQQKVAWSSEPVRIQKKST